MRGLRHLRHPRRPDGDHEGGDLVREPGRRRRQPPGRGSRVVTGPGPNPGHRSLERRAGPHRHRGRDGGPATDLLHRALPLPSRPQRGQRRQRRLSRRRRADPPRTAPDPLRQLLGVGHLPVGDRAGGPPRPPPGRGHGPVAGRRRRAERMAAQVGHRRGGRVADERGLGRPDHRRGLRLRRPQLRRPGRPGGHGQGGDGDRDRSRPRDRAPVPGPVPGPALRGRRRPSTSPPSTTPSGGRSPSSTPSTTSPSPGWPWACTTVRSTRP